MKKTIASVFVLGCANAFSAVPAPQLMLVGETFHGDEVPGRNGETWLALVVDGGKATLQSTTLKIEAVNDPIGDGPDDRTGRSVAAPGIEPRVLLRDIASLRAGDVAVAIADVQPMSAATPLPITFGGTTLNLEVRCSGTGDALACSVVLGDGATEQEQVLFETGAARGESGAIEWGDAIPSVLFAGDLDRDGRVDLLIDTTDHYNLSRPTLFLSGAAKQGQHVAKVAQQSITGC